MCDTLNNTAAIPYNTSTSLPVIPTPYYCLNNPDDYNPGAVNPLGDSLVFSLVQPRNGTGANACSSTLGSLEGYATVTTGAPLSATNPLENTTGFSFNSTNGQIAFTPGATQTAVVDYLIQEYRSGVHVGTCMREMNIIVRTCDIPAPTGTIRTPTNGAITSDSVTFEACENSGIFSFTIAGQEDSTSYNIYMTASNIPTGATYSVANDSTNHPVATFTWTSTGVTPGTYSFDILYSDNDCPVPSQSTIAYNVIIEPVPSPIAGTITTCTGASTTLTDTLASGVWTSSNTSVATAGSGTGIIEGVAAGIDTITYSYSAAACKVTTSLSVTGPKAITGTKSVCPALTTTLADLVTGGVWTSSSTATATVGSSTGIVTGVVSGTANITYTLPSTGCYVTAQVTVAALAAIAPASTIVCIGNTVSLTDATSGGIWSSSSTTLATVTATGVVNGVAAGTVDIFYSLGSCYATATVSVSATGPAAITPSTAVTMCVGGSATLADASTGGTWSSSTTGIASVNSTTGVVTGLGAGGATITYFLGGCNVVKPVTVISGIAAITPGTSTICIANTESLTETTTGGTWSSGTTTVATVGSTGIVTGVAAGTSLISYTVGTCVVTATVTVSPGPGAIATLPITICRGTTVLLTDLTSGGTWSSNNTTVASITAGGIVTGATTGTATISYTQSGCAATAVATVTATPAAILPATAVLCTGNTATLTETVTGGVWSSNSTTVASVTGGVVTGIGVGTALISYSSGTCIVTATVTVDLVPNPGLITGASVVCVGGTTGLVDAATGGAWSSTATAIATVTTGGVVTGVTTGTTTISYGVVSSCGTVATTHIVSVDAAPTAGTITGSASLCAGTTDLLSDLTTGGTWSASNTHATIGSATGLVNGVSAGIDTIKYTITSSCGTVSTTLSVTVGAFLSAGTITGTVNAICAGATLSVADATTGGTWSSSNTSATINTAGLVTGASGGGLDTIEYTVTSSCGAAVASYPITVNPIPAAAAIVGSSVLCVGSPSLFTDATTGGVWTSSNTNASVSSSSGLVTGVALGTSIISYTVTNACGTSIVTFPITMSATVSAGTVSGSTSLCIGSTTTLTDAAGSGTWSASNTSAEVSSSGVVTGLSTGVDTIYYTVATGCGSAVASLVISINSSVVSSGTILGPSSVCVSSLIDMTNPTASGGDWSSSNSHATITTGGSVTGISPGTDTISYTITSTCGVASTSKVISIISALPTISTILGPSVVCVGSSVTLTDATSGGVWSSLNGNAIVGSLSGSVTGVATGTDIISYTITTACGSTSAGFPITMTSSVTAGTISGPDSVCRGSSILLTDAAGVGTWTSGNTNATVSAGVVVGVATGTAPISYTVTNSCGTAFAISIITIVPSVTASTISGPSSVCTGSEITLTDLASGGTWVASNGSTSVVGAGIIEGMTVGIDTITYTINNTCGISTATKIVAVQPGTVASPVIGPTHQCTGARNWILLRDLTTGGLWSSFDPAIATIDPTTGVVTGMSAGLTELTYTVTSAFGCAATATSIDTVFATPILSGITGSATACVGSTTLLADSTSGGAWTSADVSVATINPVSGVLSGVSTGTVIISYEVVNSCGTSFVVRDETISTTPAIGSIAGPTSTCVGSTITLTDATTGGVWGSTNTSIATAGASTGVITGVAPGLVTIDYVYTGSCPLTISTSITITSGPAVDAITGTTSECIGTSTFLTDGTFGGVWSSGSTSIATVSATGTVIGIATGTATIFYTITSGGCTVSVAAIDTVLGIPAESPITGASAICAGASLILSNSAPDGAWSSGNTSIAVINPLTGVATGVSGGVDKIYYTITNICGHALDSVSITINAGPTVSAISAAFTSLCSGTSVTLSDAGTSGGVWTSSNTAIATVSSTGVVTGVSGGTDTVRYTVTNADGCSGSAMISLSIGGSILSGAISPTGPVTICHGHTVFMHVVSGGTGTTYQWLLNGGALLGATNSAYTATSVGIYSAVISNGTCSETIPGPTVVAPPNPIIIFSSPLSLSTGSFAAYEWFLNGVLLPTDHGSSITITGAGTYKVVVTDYNGCSDTSGGYIVTGGGGGGTNGVNAVTNPQDIKVYPNPATSMLYIDAPVNVNVSVVGIDGKILISKKDVTSIDISALSDGLYMIMVYDENNLLLRATKFAKVQ